ncbi:Kinesin motor domain [Phytophthora infestans]|uniref:Kinesin motor domain n=1 Tax=Phytophthora infestans TaxID=4787 RepID=A0A8S9UCS3_PHYIN|nr:Kinesin motor domain [Phytophthora infestans]
MVPDREWRPAGKNMDKRTARKVHASDFQRTLRELRKKYLLANVKGDSEENGENREVSGSDHMHVYVRKRPLLPPELCKHEFDVITAVGQREIVIHECKMYPDMGHKYVVSHHQRFSTCYVEKVDTETVYEDAAKHLLLHAMGGGKSVCIIDVDFVVSVSAVEIAGSKCYDLIHDRSKVLVCDDGEGNTTLVGTTEVEADSTNALLEVFDNVKDLRSTEATTVNHQSSRSHLVCYINLRHRSARDSLGKLYGQLVLLDLAGSERNEDSFYHDAARRKEAIEINKSHLALKECVRAIGREDNTGFVPYRASVLTRILKSCLWSTNSRASVIATISPLSIDTEHTLHTLLCAGQMLEDTPHISTDRVDVKEAGEAKRSAWFRFENGTMIVMLIRFTHARFTQLCGGNSLAGGHLLKAFRDEVANRDKMLKARRERNAARRK